MTSDDAIEIRSLEVWCRIGASEAERTHPQRLLVDVALLPRIAFSEVGDRLERTADYALVAARIVEEAAARRRHLIETLTVDLAGMLIREFPLREARVRVRKMVLKNAEWASATHTARSA